MINYAASLHVAASCNVCDLIEFAVYSDEVDDPGEYLASPYVANQEDIYVQDGGSIRPPEKPGLGVVLDEDALEKHRVD
jgi:L-alanine-DL-glutamate epimerase-like enolase superfamily enzyme